jgi:hypothetical protein
VNRTCLAPTLTLIDYCPPDGHRQWIKHYANQQERRETMVAD